ncbi:hypothetical protein SDC9_73638 [bioreactor metagenome]|uniref:Uncharacterized protein n=1 Tax=bioreactor metagenome TaxID=1076179 RepID=A0A644YKV2_9ZZZZ
MSFRHAPNKFRIGLNPLLRRPFAQQEIRNEEACQRYYDAPHNGQAKIRLKHNGDGQNAGSGGHQGVRQEQAQTGKGRHGGHGDVLALGQHGSDGSGQHHGDVAENRDGHDESGQGRSQLHVLATKKLNEKVGDGLGRAGIFNGHGNNGAQNDGDTHASQRISKAAADIINRADHTIAKENTGTQSRYEQRQYRVHFQLHNHYYQGKNRDHQN